MCRPLEVMRVQLLVFQSDIEDIVPMEADILEVVRGLMRGRAGGPLGMGAEDLKGWVREATRKKEPVRRRWEILVRLVHQAFGDGTPPEEFAWEIMVLVPK